MARHLARYKRPPSFQSAGGKIAQPQPDPSKPLMEFSPDNLIWSMSDDDVTRHMSETTPPVNTKSRAKGRLARRT
ncbi:MAG TPA: hypothetical protein VN867_01390 [Candidatus Binataceae bacterium]|nr:hypothetical protein [Candidatus Binataceae bacterium]